jgi:hypothetical protein
MEAVIGAGALLAWAGGALLVLSEGRRGLAAGLALAGVGLALTIVGQPIDAAVVAVMALVAALIQLRGSGRPGWAVVPTGSTPRIILVIVAGVAGVFAAVSLVPAPEPAQARAAIVVAGALAAARVLSTQHRSPALASASTICFAIAALEALVYPGVPGAAIAAAIAGGLLALLRGGDPVADGN